MYISRDLDLDGLVFVKLRMLHTTSMYYRLAVWKRKPIWLRRLYDFGDDDEAADGSDGGGLNVEHHLGVIVGRVGFDGIQEEGVSYRFVEKKKEAPSTNIV